MSESEVCNGLIVRTCYGPMPAGCRAALRTRYWVPYAHDTDLRLSSRYAVLLVTPSSASENGRRHGSLHASHPRSSRRLADHRPCCPLQPLPSPWLFARGAVPPPPHAPPLPGCDRHQHSPRHPLDVTLLRLGRYPAGPSAFIVPRPRPRPRPRPPLPLPHPRPRHHHARVAQPFSPRAAPSRAPKAFSVSSSTAERRAVATSCSDASTSASSGSFASIFRPMAASMASKTSTSYCDTSVTARPPRPARAVRPQRWIKSRGSAGTLWLRTQPTFGMSMPRAATSVATRSFSVPCLKRPSAARRLA